MNVCMIAYTFYETDHRVRRYAEALASQGHRVDMIVLRGENQEKKGTLNGVNLLRIQRRTYNERGPLSFFFKIMSFFVKGSFLLTLRHLRRGYKVVHIHNLPDFLVFMAIVPRLMKARVILDIHDILPEFYSQKFGIPFSSFSAKILLLVERISVRFAHHVIVANDIWRDKIIARDGVTETSCTTILNYPILNYFKFREPNGISDNFNMVYPGTLSYIHGVDIAIRALAEVKKKIRNVNLHIYGRQSNQSFRQEIDSLIDELDLKENVRMLPPVKPDRLKEIYSIMHVGLVPKREGIFASEAFSTKILDYMASGLPVVASRTTVDEYYFDDSMVMFFRPEDFQDLAQCIIQLYFDREKRRSLAIKSKNYINENNWGNKKYIYLNLIDSFVNCKGQEVQD